MRCKVVPKPKLTSMGFSQRVWKLIPAKIVDQKMNSYTSPSTPQRFYDEADGAVRRDHVTTNMPNDEQTRYRDKEKWIDALGRSTDKPRMVYCEDQRGTIFTVVQNKDTVKMPESIQPYFH